VVLNSILLGDLLLNGNSFYIDLENTVVIAFVAVLILWFKLLYWFRLFKWPSFYIRLIIETIKGIGVFTMIFVVILMAFANALYILNVNRNEPDAAIADDEGDLLFEEAVGHPFLDALLNQYMLALGEFGTDNFSADGSKNSQICWMLFVAATFLSQITILNMLIAIMGDTFGRVYE